MIKCNQMIFDAEKNKDALELALRFLKSLLEHNLKSMIDFNDIHMYQEESLIIVEWTQIFYNMDFPQEHFELIDLDHSIVKEVTMPDNSVLYIFEDDDEKQIIEDWYKENSEYAKERNVWVDCNKEGN